MNIKWIRWIIVIAIICVTVLVAGYRLVQPEPAEVSAAPGATVSKNVSINSQATQVEQVTAPVVQPTILFEDDDFDYHVSYPAGWDMLELSSDVVFFQSVDGVTRVKVEVVGAISVDGLAAFVERSLAGEQILSRQLLTIHGLPAQRVITFADSPGGQKTSFFIDAGETAYLITGTGQQPLIESVARSFNAPQVVALR